LLDRRGNLYEGQWSDDKRHGKGRMDWKNGAVYEGDWFNNKSHGVGRIVYPNGDGFQGQGEYGLRHGQGRCWWRGGASYEGFFFENRISGNGIMKYPLDEVTIEGNFSDNVPSGTVTINYPLLGEGMQAKISPDSNPFEELETRNLRALFSKVYKDNEEFKEEREEELRKKKSKKAKERQKEGTRTREVDPRKILDLRARHLTESNLHELAMLLENDTHFTELYLNRNYNVRNVGKVIIRLLESNFTIREIDVRECHIPNLDFFEIKRQVKKHTEMFTISAKELELVDQIGAGSFGQVYKATWRGGSQIAIKRVTAEVLANQTKLEKTEFLRELWLQKSLNPHPNIITLFGLSQVSRVAARKLQAKFQSKNEKAQDNEQILESSILTRDENENDFENEDSDEEEENETTENNQASGGSNTEGKPRKNKFERRRDEQEKFVIMELAENGSLLSYIRKHRELPTANLVEICKGVACGLQSLALQGIIHRDVAARNVLVDAVQHVKIADFGLAKRVSTAPGAFYKEPISITGKRSGSVYPIRWLAPECATKKEFTWRSDVYSFGILMYEVLSYGKLPFNHLVTNKEVLDRVLHHKEKPEMPNSRCPLEVYQLILQCTEADPLRRPSFANIVEKLDQVVTKLTLEREAQMPEWMKCCLNEKKGVKALDKKLIGELMREVAEKSKALGKDPRARKLLNDVAKELAGEMDEGMEKRQEGNENDNDQGDDSNYDLIEEEEEGDNNDNDNDDDDGDDDEEEGHRFARSHIYGGVDDAVNSNQQYDEITDL